MMQYRFGNPTTVVEVTTGKPVNARQYEYTCLCRPYGHRSGLRKTYIVHSTSSAAAGRAAMALYRKDYGKD